MGASSVGDWSRQIGQFWQFSSPEVKYIIYNNLFKLKANFMVTLFPDIPTAIIHTPQLSHIESRFSATNITNTSQEQAAAASSLRFIYYSHKLEKIMQNNCSLKFFLFGNI